MENITALLLEWGLSGLIVAAFTESFCSPILPDVVLLPLALANPHLAIYYGFAATAASVLGGFVGYWIGRRWGMPIVHKMIPGKYAGKVREFADGDNVSWTIFLAALSPIPYKCVSITAGALRVKLSVFIAASVVGRAKRFFLEAVAVYYFGEAAMAYFRNHSKEIFAYSLAFAVVLGFCVYLYGRYRKSGAGGG